MWRPVDLYDFKTSLGHIVSLSLKQKQAEAVRKDTVYLYVGGCFALSGKEEQGKDGVSSG